MILTRLTLHNVGAFRGAHAIELSSQANKPVVLVGALNGSGKTTVLESIQLALYGRSARHLLQDSKGYSDYLTSLINKNVNPRDGASVNLEFIHKAAGKETHFSVLRTWSMGTSTLREDLQISCDGEVDSSMSERWVEFVSAMLPVQIADLFLFDGERVKALAEPETSAELLRTGVHALLGLDLVDNLSRSLTQLERRLQRARAAATEEVRLGDLESAIEALEKRRLELREKEVKNQIDDAEKSLKRARERLQSEGGDLLENRHAIAQEAVDRRQDLETTDAELRELAADATPLNLVRSLASDASEWINATDSSRVDDLIRGRFAEKKGTLLTLLAKSGVKRSAAAAFLDSFAAELAPNALDIADQMWVVLLGGANSEQTSVVLGHLSSVLADGIVRWEQAAERLAVAEQRLAAVPAEDRIQHLLRAVADAEVALALATERYNNVVSERESIDKDIVKKREQLDQVHKAQRDFDRLSSHGGRARDVLAAFRVAVAARKLHALEKRIAANFKQLVRKSDLVTDVRINPDSYQMEILGGDGSPVRTDRLSAGERQLLAVAVLWSLGQASGRQLPVVIDTPLGRLDSLHRGQLVENYFPHASHQVILLSTDEEVHGQYYDRLRPYISREYLISYRERDRTSAFAEGYFRVEAAA